MHNVILHSVLPSCDPYGGGGGDEGRWMTLHNHITNIPHKYISLGQRCSPPSQHPIDVFLMFAVVFYGHRVAVVAVNSSAVFSPAM